GKDDQFRLALACLLAGGHLLLEDEPGMGKTSFAKTIAGLLGMPFSRIQFTSDLLPADVVGVNIFDREKNAFVFHPGPIFSKMILGDELNRASPKTQSAFLQAMEEQAVSNEGKTYTLEKPFFFIATQNPRRSIGTFPLPESQLDRFLMKLSLGYPSRDAEKKILQGALNVVDLKAVLSLEELIRMQGEVRAVKTAEPILNYIVDLAHESRHGPQGLSPRASLGLLHASQAMAWLSGRSFVTPEDVQAVAVAVMGHRLVSGDELNPRLGEERAKNVLAKVKVP
ncbi:MAG: MoxR family ATPase, partial [Proteobacteria bacterium]